MTGKGLKRLNRKELLEMLVEQGREVERLQRELDEAQTEQKRRMDEADAYAKNVVSRIRTVLENHPELREQLDRQ